ncbi:MAG: molybdopterin-dependent oxidoreductase [Candidatus Sumerlaeota bacterium]|nr:molybdopterin-dependent oxidoreductase [Candidatus Sumerlaeota bacterium]
MDRPEHFASEHASLTRRFFLQLGAGAAAVLPAPAVWAKQAQTQVVSDPLLVEAVSELEYLTPLSKFRRQGGRGNPRIDTLPADQLPSLGLTPETWRLEIVPDPDSDSEMGNPLSNERGNALDFPALMKLAETRAVRFLHVLSCTNAPTPYGMGLWEGVPLREVFWMTEPKRNIRRIFYYGDYSDDPKYCFQSSLPISRVLEEAPGEAPVILCYKMNGQFLSQAGGGPVRLVAPGFYGNRSIKWLRRILATNTSQSNDSYAERNNDVESPIKTCARFIQTPKKVRAGQPVAITGLAQVGPSGLSKAQYWIKPAGAPMAENDPYLAKGDWQDAAILPPPEKWGGDLPNGELPPVMQMDPETGKPFTWPIPNTLVHWAALATAAAPGPYELRCRTVDANGIAQPLPRPFGRSGKNEIAVVALEAEA